MKIFAVYSRLIFTKKPDWLDAFKNKYNYPYAYHVTLKQPTYIPEDEIENVKNTLASLFNKVKFPEHKIDIVFDNLVIDTPIMIEATKKGEVGTLQDKVAIVLKSYNNFVNPGSKNWEEDFKPHITISDDLDAERLEQAKLDIQKDVRCEATIKEVVLSMAEDMTSSEDSKEKTIYKL